MMTKRTIFLHIVFSLVSIYNLQAQVQFEIPTNFEFQKMKDFEQYEQTIVEAAKWLEETSLDQEIDKRQKVEAFVIAWSNKSPSVNIELTGYLSSVYGKNEHLLVIYIASYCRHQIENKLTATKRSSTKAALLSMMNVYKKGIKIIESKEMKKLIKLSDNGQLDDFIRNRF